ncbi:hypothetical protein SMD44_p10139 (plasmid) [Streptomyces alboflavus]|uniref:Uncharacterized protein n=1 Tax=Streptomyces alboflavus TaxID=67267 RepID=A0A291W3N9_9ACTN|nr:hypothetical protein SMD44_p10139 [Streptomyces alboflavus]
MGAQVPGEAEAEAVASFYGMAKAPPREAANLRFLDEELRAERGGSVLSTPPAPGRAAAVWG